MIERMYTIEEVRKRVLVAALAGVAGAIGALVLLGETGGNYMRGELRAFEAEQAAYQQQCEATANRALGATRLAADVLKDR